MKRTELHFSLTAYVKTQPVCWLRIRRTQIYYTEVETGIVIMSHNLIQAYYDNNTQVLFKFYSNNVCASATHIAVEEFTRLGVLIKYIVGLYDTTYPIYVCEYKKWLRFPTYQKNRIMANDYELLLNCVKTKLPTPTHLE